MISNEKYTGDVIFRRPTPIRSSTARQLRQKDQYAMADHHEAIISREVFEAANALVQQRGKKKGIIKAARNTRAATASPARSSVASAAIPSSAGYIPVH
jgi:hypothetical protein